MTFQKATKYGAKLRMSLTGPSGAGKTWTALALASHLAGDGRVAVVDTENGGASQYANFFDFDVQTLDAPYHPDRYISLMKEAEEAGYAVLIVDSISHEWAGPGGILEIVDDLTAKARARDNRQAWGEAGILHNRFQDAIKGCKLHLLCTMRSKTETVADRNEQGKTIARRVGLAPIQRDGMEFEFLMSAVMEENVLTFIQARDPALYQKSFHRPGKELAEALQTWLTGLDPWQAARDLAKTLGKTSDDWKKLTAEYRTPDRVLAALNGA